SRTMVSIWSLSASFFFFSVTCSYCSVVERYCFSMSWWRRSSNSWCCSASWRNCWSLCSRKFFTSCASAAFITPPSFIAKGPIRRVLRAKYHSGGQTLNGSCSAGCSVRRPFGIVAPQDQRIFDWVGVVVTSSARDIEAETLIQAPRAGVARAYFERRASRAEPPRFGKHVVHQRRSVAESSVLRTQRDVVDVNLIEHEPERAETGNGTIRRSNNVDMADGTVLQLPCVHLARPRTGERFTLHLEH